LAALWEKKKKHAFIVWVKRQCLTVRSSKVINCVGEVIQQTYLMGCSIHTDEEGVQEKVRFDELEGAGSG